MESELKKNLKGKSQALQSKLDILLELTSSINENSSQKVLFNNFKNILLQDLGINRFSFFYHENEWLLTMYKGIEDEEVNDIDFDKLLSNYREIAVLGADKTNDLKGFDIIIPLYNKRDIAAYLLLADIEDEARGVSPIIKHLKFIQTLGNIIVVAMENKQLAKSRIREMGMQKELDLAQKMQSMLFPKKLPPEDQLKIKAFSKYMTKI